MLPGIQDHLVAVAIQLDRRKAALEPFDRQMLAFIDAHGPKSAADVSRAGDTADNLRLGVSRGVAGNPATRSAGHVDERHLRSVILLRQ